MKAFDMLEPYQPSSMRNHIENSLPMPTKRKSPAIIERWATELWPCGPNLAMPFLVTERPRIMPRPKTTEKYWVLARGHSRYWGGCERGGERTGESCRCECGREGGHGKAG